MDTCVFCNNQLTNSQKTRCEASSQTLVNCNECGSYCIHDLFGQNRIKESFNPVLHLIAGYFHENRISPEHSFIRDITQDYLLSILKNDQVPNTAMQKINKTILLSYKSDYLNMNTWYSDLSDVIPYHYYAKDKDEFASILNGLLELGFASKQGIRYKMTVKGMQYAESLLQTSKNSNTVFIAMPFSKYDTDDSLKNTITQSVQEATDGNLTASIVGQDHNGQIIDKIIAEIKTSRFVIADITRKNANVYWEAGYAKGLGKDVILICDENWYANLEPDDQKAAIAFDLSGFLILRFKSPDDLKEKLIYRIKATIL